MCLILLAWQSDPGYPLVVAANRDERFDRPTRAAGFWADQPDILAGRDLEGGGTWLGIRSGGRFAALTNYRDPALVRAGAPSRGELVKAFLASDLPPGAWKSVLEEKGAEYNGYNLLFGDGEELYYQSNLAGGARRLEPGIYGLSNHLLDTPWPKVALGKSRLATALAALPDDEGLLHLLKDDSITEDGMLPRTGVSLEWERLLSAAFVRSPAYGTRSSTIVIGESSGRTVFEEVRFDHQARETGRDRFILGS